MQFAILLTTWVTWQPIQWVGQASKSSTQVVTHPSTNRAILQFARDFRTTLHSRCSLQSTVHTWYVSWAHWRRLRCCSRFSFVEFSCATVVECFKSCSCTSSWQVCRKPQQKVNPFWLWVLWEEATRIFQFWHWDWTADCFYSSIS